MKNVDDLIKTYEEQTQVTPIAPKKEEIKTMKELKEILKTVGIEHLEQTTEEGEKVPKIPHYVIGKSLMRYATFILIGDDKDSARLHVYNLDTGIYDGSSSTLNSLISAYDYRTKTLERREVYEYLRIHAPLKHAMKDRYYIPVKNGVYDLRKKELLPFSPKYIITSTIDTPYSPNATNPTDYFNVDEWMLSIADNDNEVYTLLWQVINEAINSNHTRGKMAILYGDGNNGKGTYQQLLIYLIGVSNIASLTPDDFNERFRPFTLLNKTANIGDDISSEYLNNVSTLMSIATGDTVTFEEKNGGTYSAQLNLFCLFSANQIPTVRNKSHGWYRRLLLIPFNADFTEQVEDPSIKTEKIKDKRVLEYVLKKALELDFTRFIEPKIVKESLQEYKKSNDFISEYILDEYIPAHLHIEVKVPTQFIRQELLYTQEKRGLNARLPYGYLNEFKKELEKATGNKYESNVNQKYPLTEQNEAHEILRRYYDGKQRKSVVLKD